MTWEVNGSYDRQKRLPRLDTVVKPPGLPSPRTMKCDEGLLTAFSLGFTPHIQRQACTDLSLRAYPVELFLHLAIAPVAPLHRMRCRGQQLVIQKRRPFKFRLTVSMPPLVGIRW